MSSPASRLSNSGAIPRITETAAVAFIPARPAGHALPTPGTLVQVMDASSEQPDAASDTSLAPTCLAPTHLRRGNLQRTYVPDVFNPGGRLLPVTLSLRLRWPSVRTNSVAPGPMSL